MNLSPSLPKSSMPARPLRRSLSSPEIHKYSLFGKQSTPHAVVGVGTTHEAPEVVAAKKDAEELNRVLALQRELTEAKSETDGTKSEVDSLRQQLCEARREAQESRERVMALKGVLTQTTNEMNTKSRELDSLIQELVAVRRELEEFRAAASEREQQRFLTRQHPVIGSASGQQITATDIIATTMITAVDETMPALGVANRVALPFTPAWVQFVSRRIEPIDNVLNLFTTNVAPALTFGLYGTTKQAFPIFGFVSYGLSLILLIALFIVQGMLRYRYRAIDNRIPFIVPRFTVNNVLMRGTTAVTASVFLASTYGDYLVVGTAESIPEWAGICTMVGGVIFAICILHLIIKSFLVRSN